MILEKWKRNRHYLRFSDPVLTPFEDNKWLKSMDDVMYFYYDVAVTFGTKVLLQAKARDYAKVSEVPKAVTHILHVDMAEALLLEDLKEDGFEREVRYAVVDLNDTFEREYSLKMERYDYRVKQLEEEEKHWTEYVLIVSNPITVTQDGVQEVVHVESITLKDISAEDLLRLKATAERFCEAAMKAHNQASIGKGIA